MDFHDWKKVSAFLKIERRGMCARVGRVKILGKGARRANGIGYWCVVFSNTSKSALDKTTNIDPRPSPLLYNSLL